MRNLTFGLMLLFVAACGGDDVVEDQTTDVVIVENVLSEELTQPDWYQIDSSKVTLDIVAGSTPVGNYWNFNGYQNGEVEIVVPVGSNVTINFQNDDPVMAHSIGISQAFDTPNAIIDPVAVFEGAISSNPTSLTESTLPGESETISFVASEVGDYSVVCYVPGHAVSGMWVKFVVSDGGEAGVRSGIVVDRSGNLDTPVELPDTTGDMF